MWNRLQERLKSAETRRQERVNAYIDGEMTAAERAAFEDELARDAALRRDVAALQQIRTGIQLLPRRPVPRNFVLNPADFRDAAPAPPRRSRTYPALRAATALAGILFVFLFTLSFLDGGTLQTPDAMVSESVAFDQADMAVEEADTAVEETVAESVMVEEELEEMAEAEVGAVAAEAAAPEEEAAREAAGAVPEPARNNTADEEATGDSAEIMPSEPESALVAPLVAEDATPTATTTPMPTSTTAPTTTTAADAVAVQTNTPDAAPQAEPPPEPEPAPDQTSLSLTPPPWLLLASAGLFGFLLFALLMLRRRR